MALYGLYMFIYRMSTTQKINSMPKSLHIIHQESRMAHNLKVGHILKTKSGLRFSSDPIANFSPDSLHSLGKNIVSVS